MLDGIGAHRCFRLSARVSKRFSFGFAERSSTLSDAQDCKRTIEITVPVDEIAGETERVVAKIRERVRLPGFRPGKAPAHLVKSRFAGEIRQEVLEAIIPKALQKQVERDNLNIVSRPDVTDVHFHEGEPLRFKAVFEVAPEIELGEYRGLTVEYDEPTVSDDDVNGRIEELRLQKADYVNEDPRPVADGDFAVVALESRGGLAEPIKQDDMMLHVGDPDTLAGFTEALRGMSPGEEKEFEVTYPEDYGQAKLSGKTIPFKLQLKMIRRRELPELTDEFAQDLGDYRTVDELRDAVRKGIFTSRESDAQREAKNKLVDQLVAAHSFPVPEAFVERQLDSNIETLARMLMSQGQDPRTSNIEWGTVRKNQRPKATEEVKGSMILDRIADREAIEPTRDDVDREVQRIARQRREPVAAVRKKLEEDGSLRRIAYHIRSEKTLAFLFDHARKVAKPEESTPAPEAE
jgi:trigger factor